MFLSLGLTLGYCQKSAEFVNPGGMWMPHQIKAQAEVLNKLGAQIDPEEFASPSSELLQAVVSLGYCSGSFVSKTGLIITNHHCIGGILNHLTNVHNVDPAKIPADFAKNGLNKDLIGKDFFEDGYQAKSLAEELPAPASQRIFVTESFEEITNVILAATQGLSDPSAITKAIDRKIAQIESGENADEGKRFKVVPFYRGTKFYLLKQFELRDIRLVFAPPKGVGNFGGDTDNWMWPRHTGDFGFLRAYVGPSGKPLAFAKDNKPYQNPQHLKVSARNLKTNDLIFVAGYPGRTNSLKTAAQVKHKFNVANPKYIEQMKADEVVLVKLGNEDATLKKKAASSINGLRNYIKKLTEERQMLTELDYLNLKQKEEDDFFAWLEVIDPDQKTYGDLKADLIKLHKEELTLDKKWGAIEGLFSRRRSYLLNYAVNLLRMAEEFPKADIERDLSYRQKNWRDLRDRIAGRHSSFDRRIDQALVLNYLSSKSKQKDPTISRYFAENLEDKIKTLYADNSIDTLETQLELFDAATSQADFLESVLANHKSPVIKLAVELKPTIAAWHADYDRYNGLALSVYDQYMKALTAYKSSKEQMLWPDANSTLRITYGLVGGKKLSTGGAYAAFTYTDEMIAKHKEGDEEFHLPQEVRDAYATGEMGDYFDPHTAKVPIDVLANVHTTNGNSGSAGLNAHGELMGLLFDGESTSMYSDYIFDSNVRSILVDSRYVLWVLDIVYQDKRLLDEMEIVLD